MTSKPIDVWLKFDSPGDEEASHEANTFRHEIGGYLVSWYHTAVGLVKSTWFLTYAEARKWYEENGYIDFSTRTEEKHE